MRMLGWNVGLALVWCALVGRLAVVELGIGFAIGYLLIGWLGPGNEARAYLRRLPLMIAFALYYAWQVLASSLRIAWEIVTPTPHRRPGFVRVPLDVTADHQIAILASLVTFTPGTVSIDLSHDRRTLLVHDMFLDDPDRARRHIKHRLERWVQRIV